MCRGKRTACVHGMGRPFNQRALPSRCQPTEILPRHWRGGVTDANLNRWQWNIASCSLPSLSLPHHTRFSRLFQPSKHAAALETGGDRGRTLTGSPPPLLPIATHTRLTFSVERQMRKKRSVELKEERGRCERWGWRRTEDRRRHNKRSPADRCVGSFVGSAVFSQGG